MQLHLSIPESRLVRFAYNLKENKAAVQVTIINYHTIDLIFKLLLEHESKSGLYLFVLVDFARSIIRLIQQPFR